MALLTEDSVEAASFHECRTVGRDQRLDAERLAQAGVYAGALAWNGHIAQHGKPASLAHAQALVIQAAEAFINETAKEGHVESDDVQTARQHASEKLGELLRHEYA